jgi:riboflavin kinase / FMN adenylyltransferase
MSRPVMHLCDPAALPEPLKGGAVAIGNFDGVHLGHQALLRRARRWADDHGRAAILLTFSPHPRAYFRPDQPLFLLTPPALRARRVAAAGMDATVTLTFDAALAGRTAESFIDDILIGRLAASHVVIGHDFHFGKGRGGSPDVLAAHGARRGLSVEIVSAVTDDGPPVSSSRIRALLREGDVAAANRLLGYEWSVTAEVLHGDKRGRLLGYPTANLSLDPSVELAHGIYAVRATVDGATHQAVASFGRRPTFDGGAPKLEVHVFDFAGDLYGKPMEVAFVARIRPELKFDDIDALIVQMDHDSAKARALLA